MRTRLLHFLRIPPQPAPPLGAPQSIRIFRAGRNYYFILLLIWGAAQIGVISGITFSFALLNELETSYDHPPPRAQFSPRADADQTDLKQPPAHHQRENPVDQLTRKFTDWPSWTLPLIHWWEYAAVAFFLIQLPITFFVTKLEYEQHWYIVTDRSLRIRTGIIRLRESTMSFANIQQVEVKQGPLQRLLRIADVRVQSAGGGQSQNQHRKDDSMHLGIFHGVDNPQEIRDLILARLKSFRQAGLGDHDDTPPSPSGDTQSNSDDSLSAARDMLNEARELHHSLQNSPDQ